MAPHLLRLFGLGQKSEPTLFGSCRVWPVYVLKEKKKKHKLVCVSWGLSCLVWGRAACKDRRFWLIDWFVWTFPVCQMTCDYPSRRPRTANWATTQWPGREVPGSPIVFPEGWKVHKVRLESGQMQLYFTPSMGWVETYSIPTQLWKHGLISR